MRRRALPAVLAALCGLLGAWVAVRAAGPSTYPTTVADVQVRVGLSTPGTRGINLYVPLANWGLRARVVGAPIAVHAEPRRVDRVGVVRTVTGQDKLHELRADVDRGLRQAVTRALLFALLGAALGGGVGVLIWNAFGVRGRRLALAPAVSFGAAVLALGVLLGWSALTWHPQRLERPDYFASGAELQQLLTQADTLRRSGEKYSDRVDNAFRAIAGLIAGKTPSVDAPPSQGGPTERVVLASDLHNNYLTVPTLRRYAHGHPTVLAGDFTINGGRVEAPALDSIAKVGSPVVAVSGNHDSPGIMDALADRGVRVLTHRDGVQPIAGLEMAGFEDPLAFTGAQFPTGIRTGLSYSDIPNGHAKFLAAVQQRWQWFRALDRRPQILIVHQQAIGQALANLIWNADRDAPPLTILVGHTHVQRLDRYGPITVVNSGSIGAGGLFGIGTQSVGLALLDFDTETGGLTASDLVSMNPATTSASAQRVVTDAPDCDDQLVFCHDAPVVPK